MMKKLFSVAFILLTLQFAAQTQYAWVQRAGFGGDARHRAVGVAIGNRGYIGMGHINSLINIAYEDWWEYDPGSNTWTQRANFPGGPRYHSVAFAIDNYAYVATGRDEVGNNYNDCWRYDPLTNTWASMANLPVSLRGAVAFVINGKGYVATGSGLDDLYEYDPVSNMWATKTQMPGQGRISGVGFAIGSKGYVCTGDINGTPNVDLWEYDPVMDAWTQKANLPGLPRMEACGFSLNGIGYVGTGDDLSSGNNYDDFWAYNPVNDSWVQVTNFAGAARRYMATFVIGNRAYAGTGTSGMNYADFWEFGSLSGINEAPAALNFSVAPNPFSSQTTLQFPNMLLDASIIITDLTGREIKRTASVSGTHYDLQRGDLAAGTYLLHIEQNGERSHTKKFIVE